MPNVVAIIQARLGSTRLPEKVLRKIIDRPMLEHVVERTQRSKNIDSVVVATTDQPADQRIVNLCKLNGWNVFTGSENDVLQRYWQCATEQEADYVVRITSDCPLISPEIIDKVVQTSLESEVDYTCNFHPQRKFPRGLDVECFPFDVLERVHQAATEPNLREHVTLMIYCRPDLFKVKGISCPLDLSDWRWTVDTADDLQMTRKIFEHFGNNHFNWRQAANAFHENPMWKKINQHIEQKKAA